MSSSSLFTSFRAAITDLKSSLIVDPKSDYNKYTKSDHHMALGFRVLASAHLEAFIENRCVDSATRSVRQHLAGKPTRGSKCLLIWWSVQTLAEIPVDSSAMSRREKAEIALKHYQKFIESNHGINGKKMRKLLLPLGFQEAGLDLHDQLANLLDSIADNRNPAAHQAVNRARQYQEPIEEWKTFETLFPLLEKLDSDFDSVCT
ncbi:hypothetical protein AB0H58_19725 [Nocardia neocaledoniensis]|uniref:hypothetical protein n=1 Tax=Nocardia neocaledoniensis TaxID=236511 RepID=UPI00340916DE